MNLSSELKTKPATAIRFWHAFLFWFKLGLISFGGPAAQIAIMHQELVIRKRWISEKRFLHALNFCMVLPGPEAQQLATYIGWLMHGTWGGIIAGVLFVFPALIIITLLSWLYLSFGELWLITGIFFGIKPAIIAIVIFAAHRIGSRALKNHVLWGMAAVSFLAIFIMNIPFPLIVIAAAVAGYIGGQTAPGYFMNGSGHVQNMACQDTAVINDNTPIPEHARHSWTKFSMLLITGALLWAVPMGLLTTVYGWEHLLTQMGWFFSKAALVTFGGAYAVLPYIYQGAIEHHQWLTAAQMIDGLALGETTPGPLIMIVAFVGFIGGYTQTILGPEFLFLSGAVAACLATWFTFLPSFIFILAGGPLVESTHNDVKFTAPLTAITAAIVGVILNLALFFSYHVLWPEGFEAHFDWIAALIAIAAAILLFRIRLGIIPVIAICAATGLIIKTMMT